MIGRCGVYFAGVLLVEVSLLLLHCPILLTAFPRFRSRIGQILTTLHAHWLNGLVTAHCFLIRQSDLICRVLIGPAGR